MPDRTPNKRMSEAIIGTLPFLRRYARAVTGSQQQGDEWVRDCADIVLKSPELLESQEDTKLAVFRMFHQLAKPLSIEDAPEGETSGRLKTSWTDMTTLRRQVLLLTVLEGFTVADAATILGLDVERADAALMEARRELQRVASVRVLIIEDEAVVALDVADIVRNAGHQVVGIAATERAAVDLARKHSPHLILADIQLREGESGINAVRAILEFSTVPVIFVTGYPERLLTGTQVELAFVISKPFDPDLLRAAMAQALDTVAI